MNQAMLLPVTLGGNQNGFAIFVFDASQLHAQIANEVRAVEDVTDLVFQQFVHGIPSDQQTEFLKSAVEKEFLESPAQQGRAHGEACAH
jgi:hypothetical protein